MLLALNLFLKDFVIKNTKKVENQDFINSFYKLKENKIIWGYDFFYLFEWV